MKKLTIKMKNCYGIKSLEYDFDFSTKGTAYAVYASNGLMKTSFAKTFEEISKGNRPKDERYKEIEPDYEIKTNGTDITNNTIYVLRSEPDIKADCQAMTNILVDPEKKARYDKLIIDLEKQKDRLLSALQKQSKVKKIDIEQKLFSDFKKNNLPDCIDNAESIVLSEDLKPFVYANIFNKKVLGIINSSGFEEIATKFNKRYQELFNKAGTIYKKGIFNPTKADISFSTLDKQGFFKGGHKVHLSGYERSIDETELSKKLIEINESIDKDETLKQLRSALAKNNETKLFNDYIECLSHTHVDLLLEKIKPENHTIFKKQLWSHYIRNNSEVKRYIELYTETRDEITEIERSAAQTAPRWEKAVKLFNERFIDMPFTLLIANQTEATLGKEKAELRFKFEDGEHSVNLPRLQVTTLSHGEERALYLLNFIFEVEERRLTDQETLFIIDDIADSFDYKNKHAIILYLKDLCDIKNFYQIILTHNFDFYRSIAGDGGFIDYSHSLMVNKNEKGITLLKAEGINNIFTKKWKAHVDKDVKIFCATIPFTRNLLEYTRGIDDPDYLKLTSLLHWRSDTSTISVGSYFEIYNRTFGTSFNDSNIKFTKHFYFKKTIKSLLFSEADLICASTTHDSLNLEDKVLLSIAIRIQAERYLINRIRSISNIPDTWYPKSSKFGKLFDEFKSLLSSDPVTHTLEEVSITVSSNIHLNSFMYEPILDLTIEHLIRLYQKIVELHSAVKA